MILVVVRLLQVTDENFHATSIVTQLTKDSPDCSNWTGWLYHLLT